MAEADQLGVELLPADDEAATPEEALEAAAAGLLDAPEEVEDDAPVAYGRTWAFDYAAGRFVREGGVPKEVGGLEGLRVWCGMATHVARFAHPVFGPGFGMDEPDEIVGAAADTLELIGDWGERITEALGVHDRILGVEDYEGAWNYDEGVVSVTFRVVASGGEVRFDDLVLGSVGG